MRQEYQQLFNDSFQTCYNDPHFIDRFYEAFLSSSEEVRSKFAHTEMKKQKKMLKQSLAYMIAAKTKPRAISTAAIRHDKKHLNISPHLYSFWLEGMIEAIRQTDQKFCQDTENAWRETLQPGIDYMIAVYNKS